MARASTVSNPPITDDAERALHKARAAVAHAEAQVAAARESLEHADANGAELRAMADMKEARARENLATREAELEHWQAEVAALEKGA